MLFDIVGPHALLPRCEPATYHGLVARTPRHAQKLMSENKTQSFGIQPILRARLFEDTLQLDCGTPKRVIFKEEPRSRYNFRCVTPRNEFRDVRIDVEIERIARHTRVMRLAVGITGRYERELSSHVAQHRLRQTLDEGLSLVSRALLVNDEHVDRRLKTVLNELAARLLHDLRCNTIPYGASAGDRMRRRNLDKTSQ